MKKYYIEVSNKDRTYEDSKEVDEEGLIKWFKNWLNENNVIEWTVKVGRIDKEYLIHAYEREIQRTASHLKNSLIPSSPKMTLETLNMMKKQDLTRIEEIISLLVKFYD